MTSREIGPRPIIEIPRFEVRRDDDDNSVVGLESNIALGGSGMPGDDAAAEFGRRTKCSG